MEETIWKVRGSNAVFEEGVRMPRRICFDMAKTLGQIHGVQESELLLRKMDERQSM